MADKMGLTQPDFQALAAKFTKATMINLATGTLGLTHEAVEDCRSDHADSQSFKVAVFRIWAYKYTGRNPAKVSMLTLYSMKAPRQFTCCQSFRTDFLS